MLFTQREKETWKDRVERQRGKSQKKKSEGGKHKRKSGAAIKDGQKDTSRYLQMSRLDMSRMDVMEVFHGILFPGHLHTQDSLEIALKFPFQDTDILIASYPKSGKKRTGADQDSPVSQRNGTYCAEWLSAEITPHSILECDTKYGWSFLQCFS